MNTKTDWELLARYLAGECSRSEEQDVESWIRENRENERLGAQLREIWASQEIAPVTTDIEELWRRTALQAGIADTSPQPRRSLWGEFLVRRRLAFAAALLALIAVPVLVWILSRGPASAPALSSLLVPRGDQRALTLSDGTRVVLDAGSEFRFPERFQGRTRDVYLTGEGLFDVRKNGARQFVVHAGAGVVRVLGTRFNVRAWKDSQRVEVTVSSGRVTFGAEGGDEEAVVVSQGERSVLREGRAPTQASYVDVAKHMRWTSREADFQDVPLREILSQLERWYDLEFILSENSVAGERLTVFIENRPIDEILELLAALTDQEFDRRGNLVFFDPKRLK